MKFKVKKFSALSVDELYDLLQLRQQIFVLEQNCIYLDADGVDKKCLHLLGLVKGKIVAYARVIPAGETYKTPSIGRVVIDEKHRGKKYAYLLMEEAIKLTKEEFKSKKITISAQLYLKEFYENLGFKTVGDVYLDCDLPHLKMIMSV
ncbi:MAG TPA: GNAT family N-acetyltransferase [Bacteroidia bacterium]|jgi:ElaA protein|nr:GNAT family N-acetyltransferase [Bacteroidia bacterium]